MVFPDGFRKWWSAGLLVLLAAPSCSGDSADPTGGTGSETTVDFGTLCHALYPVMCANIAVRTSETTIGGTRLVLSLANPSDTAAVLERVGFDLAGDFINQEEPGGTLSLRSGATAVGVPTRGSVDVAGDWDSTLQIGGRPILLHLRARFGNRLELPVSNPTTTWIGSGIWGCTTGDISGYQTCGAGRVEVVYEFAQAFRATDLTIAFVGWRVLATSGWTVPSCGPSTGRNCIAAH